MTLNLPHKIYREEQMLAALDAAEPLRSIPVIPINHIIEALEPTPLERMLERTRRAA